MCSFILAARSELLYKAILHFFPCILHIGHCDPMHHVCVICCSGHVIAIVVCVVRGTCRGQCTGVVVDVQQYLYGQQYLYVTFTMSYSISGIHSQAPVAPIIPILTSQSASEGTGWPACQKLTRHQTSVNLVVPGTAIFMTAFRKQL